MTNPMRLLYFPFVLISSAVFSQSSADDVVSGMYTWNSPASGNRIRTANILSGSAHDFNFLAIDACEVLPSKRGARSTSRVPLDEEHLMIVKKGTLNISFGDSRWSVGPASVVLLMPGQEYVITRSTPCWFYLMRYRSREPLDAERGLAGGGSIVHDWSKLTFREHSRGGVRSYFERPTAMCRRFEMHVTTLKPGLRSHDPHTHRAEEIILMLEDNGGESRTEMLIGENTFRGGAGDLYYIGTNLLHGIRNVGTVTCSYFAFQFE